VPKKQSQLLKIHVPGFFKNNPKIENKRFYFRINSRIFSDPKFSSLSFSARYLYICLLCLCSENNSEYIEVEHNSLVKYTQLYRNSVTTLTQLLQSARLISITYDPPIVEYSKEKKSTLHYNTQKLEMPFTKRQLESALKAVGNNEPASDYVCNVLLPLVCREFSSSDEFADFLDTIINSKVILQFEPTRASAYLIGALQKRLGLKNE